jgi:hypothetical protein
MLDRVEGGGPAGRGGGGGGGPPGRELDRRSTGKSRVAPAAADGIAGAADAVLDEGVDEEVLWAARAAARRGDLARTEATAA